MIFVQWVHVNMEIIVPVRSKNLTLSSTSSQLVKTLYTLLGLPQ